jgi:dihydrofolate synthase/folylpolyglutamate synthase
LPAPLAPLRTLEDALRALSACTDYEKMQRTGRGYSRFNLRTISRLVASLGEPHRRFRSIHVAGTKGKGSTTHLLGRILQAAGERVGEYTSPHLHEVTERIRVQGRDIPGEALASILSRMSHELSSGAPDRPTFFDFMTAIAFAYFADQGVDFAVVEVGLGGRLDSTNVLVPEVSVITSVSRDHTETLGESLAEIAAEKAGIVKPGVPVVTGVTAARSDGSLEAHRVIRQAAHLRGSPFLALGRDFDVGRVQAADVDGRLGIRFRVDTWRTSALEIAMPVLGVHQARNAAVAVAAVDALRERGAVRLEDSAIAEALLRIRLPARIEILGERPIRLIDAAHNDASARATCEAIRLHFPGRRAVVCFGSARDKDIERILRELRPSAEAFVLTRAPSPRAADPEEILPALSGGGIRAEIRVDPAAALERAEELAGADGIVLVTGSFYLAGAVREVLVPAGSATCRG